MKMTQGQLENEEQSTAKSAVSSNGTRLVASSKSTLSEIAHLYQSSKKLSICTVFNGLGEIMDQFCGTLAELAIRGRDDESNRIRCLTSFTNKQQTDLVDTFLRIGIQVRHIEDFPALSFTMIENDDEPVLILGLWQSFLISTDPAYTRHFQELFNQLWLHGMNAAWRIEEIRSGTNLTEFEVIGNPEEAMKRIWDAIRESHEVLMLLSSPNMLRLQINAGTFHIMKGLVEKGAAISARVLVPSDRELVSLAGDISKLEFRYMDKSLTTCPTLLIIDRERCFVLETKNATDRKST